MKFSACWLQLNVVFSTTTSKYSVVTCSRRPYINSSSSYSHTIPTKPYHQQPVHTWKYVALPVNGMGNPWKSTTQGFHVWQAFTFLGFSESIASFTRAILWATVQCFSQVATSAARLRWDSLMLWHALLLVSKQQLRCLPRQIGTCEIPRITFLFIFPSPTALTQKRVQIFHVKHSSPLVKLGYK